MNHNEENMSIKIRRKNKLLKLLKRLMKNHTIENYASIRLAELDAGWQLSVKRNS